MAINQQTHLKFIQLSIFLSTSIFCTTASIAGIYKWVDEQGNVHYSQQRPANATSEKMDVQKRAPRDESTYNRPGTQGKNKDTTTDSPSKTAKPEKKPETKAEKQRRLAACEQARKSLQTMESVGRIRAKDKNGDTVFLSQAQKEEKMKQSREMLTQHCK